MINFSGGCIHWKNFESKDMNLLKVFKLWPNFDQKGYSNLHYLSSAIYNYNRNKCQMWKTGKQERTKIKMSKTHNMLGSNKCYGGKGGIGHSKT